MPGILGYNNSPGLLGNLGQALQSYATRTEPGGAMADQPTREEYEEYERAKQAGFQGTFDEWRAQKRQRGMGGMGGMGLMSMMGNLQPGGPMSGFGMLRRAMGGY